jgi:PAS domain S-box-containing protein
LVISDSVTGEIVQTNERGTEILGYTAEELEGKSVEAISADDPEFNHEQAMEKMQAALEGEPQRFDWLVERKDGTTLWIEVSLKQTTIGDETRLMTIVRDITERREAQKHRRQLYGIVSDADSTAEQRVNELLDLGREHLGVETGFLTRIEEGTQRVVEAHGPHERIQSGSECPLSRAYCRKTIETDESRLEQLFENLFRNAIEHTDEGVTVGIGRSSTGFYVEDNGPGIPETEREQMLVYGYTTSESGTGFGLSIVEQIVEAHDWGITVSEGTAGGARFEIRVANAAGGAYDERATGD